MAYKVFQNGYQLPASDLNNYLMNQTVMVFADSTARSTAITSPVEGMLTYLESTNSYEGWNGSAWTDINDNTGAIAKSLLTTTGDLIVASGASTPARLGIGTSGQVLQSNGTTASWQTLSSSGGMSLISTTTLSGTSTTISSIPSGYKSLYICLESVAASAYSTGFLLPNNEASATATKGFYGSSWVNNNSGSLFSNTSNVATEIVPTSGYDFQLSYFIDNYTSTKTKPIEFYGGTGAYGDKVWGAGYSYSSSAITSLVVKLNGSATFVAGTVKVYGVN